MRHFCCGIAVLALLLGLCLGITGEIQRRHQPIAALLEEATLAGAAEDWPQALALASQAHKKWQQGRAFTAAVSDHTPMDEIDGMFFRLSVLAAARNRTDFASASRELAQKTRAMIDAHSWAWENLL